MSDELGNSFESIESAQEFVELLIETIDESKQEIRALLAAAGDVGEARRLQALQLVAYKLDTLGQHMATSRRILNDLRSLRRLLLEERQAPNNPA